MPSLLQDTGLGTPLSRRTWIAATLFPLLAPAFVEFAVRFPLVIMIFNCVAAPPVQAQVTRCQQLRPPYFPTFVFAITPATDMAVRYSFIAVLMILAVGVLAAIGTCAWIIGASLRAAFGRQRSIVTMAAAFAITALLFAVLYAAYASRHMYSNRVQEALWPAMPTFFNPRVFQFVRAFFSALLSVSLAGAASAILLPTRHSMTSSDVAVSLRRLRTLVYVGAASLVAYVIEQRVAAGWALQGIDKAHAVEVSQLIQSLVFLYGAAFSIMLVTISAPVMVVLRSMAYAQAERALPGGTLVDRTEWMKAQGTLWGFPQHLAVVFSLLGPLLASGPVEVLKVLGGL
jgi:hypothetical protein